MIHERTVSQLEAYSHSFPHAAILHGRHGVGLRQAVAFIAEKKQAAVEWVLPEKKETVDREGGAITVDIIRRLYETTKTRSASSRIIAIDRAETMTVQAQNAFLKLLEEPNEMIHFILLVGNLGALLPTIVSRSQLIEVLPLTSAQTEVYLDTLAVTDATKRAQLVFLANGLPELLEELVANEEAFEAKRSIVADARVIVQGSPYDAVKVAHAYKDDRGSAMTLLLMAIQLLEMAVSRAPEQRYIARIDTLLKAHEALEQNGNVRLHLTAALI